MDDHLVDYGLLSVDTFIKYSAGWRAVTVAAQLPS